MKKKSIFALVLLSLVTIFQSCSDNSEPPMIGSGEPKELVIDFSTQTEGASIVDPTTSDKIAILPPVNSNIGVDDFKYISWDYDNKTKTIVGLPIISLINDDDGIEFVFTKIQEPKKVTFKFILNENTTFEYDILDENKKMLKHEIAKDVNFDDLNTISIDLPKEARSISVKSDEGILTYMKLDYVGDINI